MEKHKEKNNRKCGPEVWTSCNLQENEEILERKATGRIHLTYPKKLVLRCV
jgi:hypothetical protein